MKGTLHPRGMIAAATVAIIIGYSTKDDEGEATSFSINHEVTDDHGNTTQIAGRRRIANGVNMLIRTGAYNSVIFIHQISGRGAASNPRAGMNCTSIKDEMAMDEIQMP